MLWMTKCLSPAAGSRVVSASSAAGAGSQRSQLSSLGLHKNEKRMFFMYNSEFIFGASSHQFRELSKTMVFDLAVFI